MNPETKTMVRDSWARVQAIGPAAAALFYDNLFKADPSLKPLFKGDMQARAPSC
jgi:hemoglobin-like flavoprotein